MSEVYNHKVVEKDGRKSGMMRRLLLTNDYSKPKYYALVEFPYPSGQGLHVGHPRPYTALDIVARKRRCKDTMYCIQWDGMHSVFLQRTMLLRIRFIRRS